MTLRVIAEPCYAECRLEAPNIDCRYAECRYAKCRGAHFIT